MQKVSKKDYPLILRVEGKLYKSLYNRWFECDRKGRFPSRLKGRNVVKFRRKDEKK